MRHVLVTGGAGFIGSNFVRHLLENSPDDYVIVADKLTYAGNMDNLDGLPNTNRYKFINVDISVPSAMELFMRTHRPDVVVNFAAETHVDRSIEKSRKFVVSNVMGTDVLLSRSLKYGVKRFVQVGTDEVYGSLGSGSPSSVEGDTLNPRSPYAASKAAADMLVMSYYHTHDLNVAITRSSNNYGPYQYPEKMIPKFIVNILHGKKVPVYGKGENVRDWLHVRDNCRGIEMVMNDNLPGEIYNIGGGNEVRNIDLTERLLTLLGKRDWWFFVAYVKDRLGHDWRYSLDTTKIRTTLGWKPEIEFGQGLHDTVRWYERNQDWWRKILKKGDV